MLTTLLPKAADAEGELMALPAQSNACESLLWPCQRSFKPAGLASSPLPAPATGVSCPSRASRSHSDPINQLLLGGTLKLTENHFLPNNCTTGCLRRCTRVLLGL